MNRSELRAIDRTLQDSLENGELATGLAEAYAPQDPAKSNGPRYPRRGTHIQIPIPMMVFVMIVIILSSIIAIQTVRSAQAEMLDAESAVDYQRGRADEASEARDSVEADLARSEEQLKHEQQMRKRDNEEAAAYRDKVVKRELAQQERNAVSMEMLTYAVENGEYFEAEHHIMWVANQVSVNEIEGEDLPGFIAEQFRLLIQGAMSEHKAKEEG